MDQNSPSIAPRRARFARPAQAFSISHQRKTQPFCTPYSNVAVKRKSQLQSAKQLAQRHTKTPNAKPLGARASEGFASAASKNRRAKLPHPTTILPPPSPGFSTSDCPRFRRPQPRARTQLMKNREKSRPQRRRFSPQSRDGTVFASPSQIAERTIRRISATDPAFGSSSF